MNQKNKKRFLTLVFLFIISSIFYLVLTNKDNLFSKKEYPNIIENSDIKSFEINIEGKKQIIEQKNGQWLVKIEDQYFPADIEKVNNLKNYLFNLKAEKIVSQNAKKYKDRFNLNSYIKINYTNGKKITLNIGKFAENGRYAQINDKNEVFIASNINDYISPLEFRNLKINLISNEKNVSKIKIKGPKQLEFKKENNTWLLNNEKIDSTKVNNYLLGIKELIADDLIIEQNLSKPLYTLEVTENNKTKNYEIYQKDDYYLLKNTQEKHLYKINEITLNSIIPSMENLKK